MRFSSTTLAAGLRGDETVHVTVDPSSIIIPSDLLPSDGYRFLGGVESTINLDDRFARAPYERSGCYRRAAAAAA